jgi:hypothetical protein
MGLEQESLETRGLSSLFPLFPNILKLIGCLGEALIGFRIVRQLKRYLHYLGEPFPHPKPADRREHDPQDRRRDRIRVLNIIQVQRQRNQDRHAAGDVKHTCKADLPDPFHIPDIFEVKILVEPGDDLLFRLMSLNALWRDQGNVIPPLRGLPMSTHQFNDKILRQVPLGDITGIKVGKDVIVCINGDRDRVDVVEPLLDGVFCGSGHCRVNSTLRLGERQVVGTIGNGTIGKGGY